ncbi:MAG: hypothetical protein JWN98_2319, partial [Abditibacteriota bacterium]|nr:hypothetical protein [Abditibacteriota bacterium]
PSEYATLTERLKTFRFGDDTAILDAVSQAVGSSRTHPDRRRLIARALSEVLSSQASFDAKQFACRELLLIADEEQVPALTALLSEERLAHYALMVLARIPGPAVDAALRRELPLREGRTQVEVINAIGERRDSAASALLSAQLNVSNAEVTAAAATALGKIGDRRAVAMLKQNYAQATTARRITYGRSLLAGAEQLRAAGDAESALAVYDLLQHPPASPELSAGALRGIVLSGGAGALPQLMAALDKQGSAGQFMALSLARELPGRAVTVRLSQHLPKLGAPGQLLLMAALQDRGDAAALPAITALSRSTNSAVQTAAIQAMGALGDASVVPHLVQIAAAGPNPRASAARTALVQLRGSAINAKLLAMLDNAAPSLRVMVIDILGQRRVAAAAPRLVREVRSRQPGVRAAVVRVLREMGRSTDLSALLAVLPAVSAQERGAIASAVTEIARRGTNEHERTGVVLRHLSQTTTPTIRAELLGILSQIGGPQALQTLRTGITDRSPLVQQSTLRHLAQWPSDAPMNDLLHLSRRTKDARLRTIALRGYLRMISLNTERAPEAALELYREASSFSSTPELKQLVLAGIAKQPSLAALEYAAQHLTDKAVRAEAELAVVEIGRSTIGPWRDQTREALEPIAATSTNESARNGAREVLARLAKWGDFISAWEVSPAYDREGITHAQLFDMPFAPEEANSAKVLWRLMPAGTNAEQPWLLDLLALWGGEQRVAYLRTSVWSETARDVVLELGSDDGTKAWWNGDVVLSENVQRAVAPGQNKVKLAMKSGWNQLMLKITQNNLGWGACARFAQEDGSPVSGLRFAVPSSVSPALQAKS